MNSELGKILEEWKTYLPNPGNRERRLIAALEVVVNRPYYVFGIDEQREQKEKILAILKGETKQQQS